MMSLVRKEITRTKLVIDFFFFLASPQRNKITNDRWFSTPPEARLLNPKKKFKEKNKENKQKSKRVSFGGSYSHQNP